MDRRKVVAIQNHIWNAISPYIQEVPIDGNKWDDVVKEANAATDEFKDTDERYVAVRFSCYLLDVLEALSMEGYELH